MWRALPLVVLLAAAPAQAAWSPPERVGGSVRGLSEARLVYAQNGDALLTGVRGFHTTRFVSLTPEPLALPKAIGRLQPIVTHGADRTLALALRFTGRDAEAEIGVWSGRIDAPLGRLQMLDTFRSGAIVDLAVNARGDAAAMWVEQRGGLYLTHVAVRRAGAPRFRRRQIVVIASGDAGSLGQAVAVTPGGEVLLAFSDTSRRRGRTVRRIHVARVRRRDGRLGLSHVVGPHLGFADVEMEVAATGRAVVMWKTRDGGIDINLPLQLWAAIRDPGVTRFARAQRLEGGGQPPTAGFGGAALDVAADGAAVVAWDAQDASGRPVEVASAPADGGFGPPQVVAANGHAGDAALGPGGQAVVTWTIAAEDEPFTDQVMAAVRASAAAPFEAPEAVSPGESAEAPVAAYDRGGVPFIAWSAAPGARPGTNARRTLSISRRLP